MSDLKLTKKSSVSPNITTLALPIIYLVVLVIVAFISIKAGYQQIDKQRKDVNAAKKTESILNEKYNTLQDAQSFISKYVDPASFALPDKNPSLYILSQMKQLTSLRPVVVADFNFGRGSTLTSEDIGSVSMSFNISGSVNDVISYYQDMIKLAPIITFATFDITTDSQALQVDTRADSFYAEYPDKLPSITQPISKLTSSEMQTLEEISTLTPPSFTTLDPNGPFTRENPFAI